MPDADRKAEGYNPLCGDRETVYLDLEGDRLKDVSFQGAGCAISTASASMMTESVKGKTRAAGRGALRPFPRPHHAARRPAPGRPELGKLEVFSGVREYPVRVKCATLPWHTFKAALDADGGDGLDRVRRRPKAESGGA
jgi:nitrogen fixation NifU-like protein